jgi:hypothetical protein
MTTVSHSDGNDRGPKGGPPFLGRNWVLIVIVAVLALVVGSVVAVDRLVAGATTTYQVGYAYGFRHASPVTALTSGSSPKQEPSLSTTAYERCTTAALLVSPAPRTAKQWKQGCVAGWENKGSRATAGTSAMTTTSPT